MLRLCGENASRRQPGQLAKDGPRSETVREEISHLNGRADTLYASSHRLGVTGYRRIGGALEAGLLAGNGDGGDHVAAILGLFAREDAHNFNGVPDHVGGALLAFRSGGHH